jgi:SHS2 domain-containing protein
MESVPGFEILEHPADIGFRVSAGNLRELFERAAVGMLTIADEPSNVEAREEYELSVESGDREALLVDWLSEVLYWYDGKRIAFREFHVTEFTGNSLKAIGRGEPRDPQRHRARVIVKAVTWHQLKIEERDGVWVAQVYLDI